MPCAREHPVNLKTGKVLGADEDLMRGRRALPRTFLSQAKK